ncbi:MAG: P-type conjugative transfer protein VirB9 [Rickettsiales bacterium]|jgi:type IV secretion system protein VirB9|nr:P-type conjugative transfer protein VirB9 [Rickettsiales bacterium]|tara:strand:- start:5192 stop:6091 length:900 start_codon:yes stop_codon:yes gene_type:complete
MKKLVKITISLTLILLTINFNLHASQFPRFLGSEKKFRSYLYNPNDVYRYVGHYNYQGFIEFGPEESVASISMGDPSLWLFEHLNNRLFLKPVGEDNSQTNMTVITNKKVYHFELMAREALDIDDKDLIFVVKFIYPDEKDKNIVQFQKKSVSGEPDMRDLSLYNFNYEYTGDPAIAPIKVFDDKKFTYFEFSDQGSEIPAIFRVDSNGFESLVNFRSAGNYIIVESVDAQFTLRNGMEIVCVYNMSRFPSGKLRNSTLKHVQNKGNSPTPGRIPNIASPSTPVMPSMSPNIRMPGMSY